MISECTKQLAELVDQLSAASTGGSTISPAPAGPVDDDSILAKIEASQQGPKFRRLWSGDWNGYDSQSDADIALCGILAFWYGPDEAAIDRLFRRSGLMRPKWNKRHHSNGDTYGRGTIGRALRGQSEFHASDRRLHAEQSGPGDGRQSGSVVPVLIDLASVEPQPVEWLWPSRIAIGKLTIISGDPGLGKSFLTLDLAARVSNGASWPDDPTTRAPAGEVVLLSAEDDLADTIRPRLDAAGADVKRIKAIQAMRGTDSDGNYERLFDLSRDLPYLEAAVRGLSGCKLVVIDPVSAYLGRTKSHDNAEVRGVLAPLSAMAARLGVAVVAVSHLRKGEGPALYRTMGSMAFVAAARAAFSVSKHPDDASGKVRLFLPLKNNIGNDRDGLAFELSARHSGNGQPCVLWSPAPVTLSADEALASPARKPGPQSDERQRAAEFLVQALADGPRLSKDVEAEAKEMHNIAKGTLARARCDLKIEAYRESNPGPWWLRLPADHSSNQALKLLGDGKPECLESLP